MKLRATYRVQLREGVDFDAVVAALPYFVSLGVSHLYLSPIMRAAPGSTHGYDAIAYDEIDPELGGVEGFDRLAEAARAAGLGILLDFVPNHMSATLGNRWWRDVLERGQKSAFAQHFDIDWTAGKLLLPILGEPYGTALSDGLLSVHFDAPAASFVLAYREQRLPLAPQSFSRILAHADHESAEALARQFALDDGAGAAGPALAALAEDPDLRAAATAACALVSNDRDALHELLEAQVWRVAHWRLGREGLTYRRFFEVVDLIGVAVERPAVFEAVHGVVGDLVRSGKVDGLRIDHIDGLADPATYLAQLRRFLGAEGDRVHLLIEKILEAHEVLRPWPVAGTTGYEFITAVAGLLVDPSGEEKLTSAHASYVGPLPPFADMSRSTKRLILTRNLAGELDRLRDLALAVAASDRATRDFGSDSLRRAIVELAAAMPVYRTYVSIAGPSDDDRAVIATAIAAAAAARHVEDEAVIAFLGRLLLLDFGTPELQAAALQFAARFQQTSGPVMAKAVEDTAFYRWTRLIALNEVGGDPAHFGGTVEDFHEAMADRLLRQPDGLTPLATHDTKRGADGRARLYALSETPETWHDTVRDLRGRLSGDADPATEWLFFQSLLGAWPMSLDPADDAAAEDLRARMEAFLVKALREAKERTSWTASDEEYERRAIAGTVDVLRDPSFRADFGRQAAPFIVAGAVNSLAQLALHLTVPGVPDVYQGAEDWDFSLVDPDNRRPVDFAERVDRLAAASATAPSDLLGGWADGVIKARILADGLALRRRLPDVFAAGEYVPLHAVGSAANRVVAFSRRHATGTVVTVVPRHPLGRIVETGVPHVAPDSWSDTYLPLDPADRYRDVTSGAEWQVKTALSDILGALPVAILEKIG